MQINNFIPTSNDDPDRVDVYNLEKWTNYSKIQTNLNNFEELTIKQAERERKLAELSEKNIKNAYYRTPEIKTIIVDSIWQDPTEGFDRLNSQPSGSKIKKFRFLKSIDTVKQDSNKKIINEVLYRKISTHKTKMDTSGVNSRFNSSTLGNFKHLQKLFNSYRQKQIINYDEILQRLQEDNIKFEKLFDYEQEIDKLKDKSKKNKEEEEDLIDEFDKIKMQINEKKSQQKKTRIHNSSLISKLRAENEALERIKYKMQLNYEELMNKLKQNHAKNNPKFRIINTEQSSFHPNIEEFMGLQKINLEKEKAEKKSEEEISRCKEIIRQNNETLIQSDQDIEFLRKKKTNFQLKLKENYLIRMKNQLEDKNCESLTWIIKSFNRVDMEFGKENLPSFLDNESQEYLFKMTNLESNLSKLQKKQMLDYKGGALCFTESSVMETLNRDRFAELNRRIQLIKKEKFEIKKVNSNAGIQYRDALKTKLEQELMDNYLNKFTAEESNLNGTMSLRPAPDQNKSEKLIISLQEEIENSRSGELTRIFKKYKMTNIEDKSFLELKKTLLLLFGGKGLNLMIEDFLKFKSELRNDKNDKKHLRSSSDYQHKKTTMFDFNKIDKNEVLKRYDTFYEKVLINDGRDINYLYNFNYNYVNDNMERLSKDSNFWTANKTKNKISYDFTTSHF